MPTLVVVPKLKPLQGKGKKQYGRNGTGASSMHEAILGRGGGIHGHVITKKSYEGPAPFPKGEGVAKLMSDAELRHRRKVNAAGLAVTSSLGLSALGAKAGAGGLRKFGKIPKIAARVPNHAKKAETLDRAALTILPVSAGVGGINGFNMAAIQRAEAKRKAEPTSKAWHSGYDPESNRHKFDRHTRTALTGGGAALGAGAVGTAGALSIRKPAEAIFERHGPRGTVLVRNKTKKGVPSKRRTRVTSVNADWKHPVGAKIRKLPTWTKGRAKGVGALAGGSAALLGARAALSHHDAHHGATYSPRYHPRQD